MKALSEPNVTTYHYAYDANGNRTTVEIKDDGLTLESTVYNYDRLNKLVSSREVTASGLYLYEYTYDDNGNLVSEDRHRQFESQRTNIRRYEYTKDNKLESVYSGNTLLVSYTYDGDGTITSSLERDLDLNQNLNIHDTNYLNSLTNNQRQLINKVLSNDSFLYELTEYITDKNRPYSETLMERDGTGQLSTIYTYGNQRINSESYNNLSGLYTYDGRGSVSAVIGSFGDFRASYWYDGLGNVKSQIHGYGAFGSGKKYYGYNAEQYNPVTGNQNLRARQVNIRRQRFLTEDTFIGVKNRTLSFNRYIYAEDNPLKYTDPSGNVIPIVAAIIIGAVVAGGIAGGIAGVATGDVKTGLAVGGVTALSVATGGTVGAAVAGSAVVASAVGTAAAGTIGVMSGAVVTSVSRNALGNVVLGENNTAEKFANDALTSAAISGTMSVAGYGISTAYNYWHSNQSTNTITENAGYVNPDGAGGRLGQEMAGAATNSRSGGCINASVDYSNRPDFYVKPSGEVIPATGYRYMPENASYIKDVMKSKIIPPKTGKDYTYFSFDNFNVARPDILQTPHDASVKGTFDTLQIIDDIHIPTSKWNRTNVLEPITNSYPEYGPGGATQAITQSEIKLNTIEKLPKLGVK